MGQEYLTASTVDDTHNSEIFPSLYAAALGNAN